MAKAFQIKGVSLFHLWFVNSPSIRLLYYFLVYLSDDCIWQENGVLEEYQLAPDGVDQARLAGESFLKALHLLLFSFNNRVCVCVCFLGYSLLIFYLAFWDDNRWAKICDEELFLLTCCVL